MSRALAVLEEAAAALCVTAYVLAVIICCLAADPAPDRAAPTSPAARHSAASGPVSRPGSSGFYNPSRDPIGKLLARLEETRP
ncbi:hypothetical protein QM467_04585 [Rhodoblastus sp. 17X3]|uniref:hypothetical protein n=1 Tax=Rhodoblastus sp. 17X3 TaxID=3047026 RepID=UPI0024B777F6|nr:hypothetical protein [Rhodoblastus sp. 17X3]MDI9847336.1 hypothetical protein [Rhodoblastus sp. 17X3]